MHDGNINLLEGFKKVQEHIVALKKTPGNEIIFPARPF